MNTKVNKLKMTLKLFTTLKIVSVLENNDVVIGSLTDNMTAPVFVKATLHTYNFRKELPTAFACE